MSGIAPWLSSTDATAAVDYYKAAFGAVEEHVLRDGDGRVQVCHLFIGEADFWVQQDDDVSPARVILTVQDPDASFTRAVQAGGRVVFDVYEGHGWRLGRLEDPSGHHWEVGKPQNA